MNDAKFSLDGLILAGGRASRLGGIDKGLEPLAGQPLIEWSIQPLRPLVNQLIINCNRNHPRYQQLADYVVTDARQDFAGPLHGVLSGMQHSTASHLLVLPCDTPLISNAVLQQLIQTARQFHDHICVAKTAEGLQPLHVIIPCHYHDDLATWLDAGNAKVRNWYQQHPLQQVVIEEHQAFYNLNHQQDLQHLNTLLAAQSA